MQTETPTSTTEEMYAPGSARLRNVRRFNKIARVILNSPLHRVLSDRLMLIRFVGRTSGRTYTTPIAYVNDGGQLLIAAGGRWRTNLRSGPPVAVRLRGNWLRYNAYIVDSDEYGRVLERMATLNPTWARYSGLEFGSDGKPASTAAAKAQANGLTLVRLTAASEERSPAAP